MSSQYTPTAMVTLLFTSIFIIGILAIGLYFWAQPARNSEQESLPPSPTPTALFDEPEITASHALLSGGAETDEQQRLLLERAKNSDKNTLAEAPALGDSAFYDQVLNLLVTNADSDAALLSLVSHVARNELPVTRTLAQAGIASWKKSPNRNSTAKALHIAALADDAALYQSTVEAALNYWRAGDLADVSPVELQALFDGEFWVLSSRTRSSGAGFVLKRILANARRELGNTTSVNQ